MALADASSGGTLNARNALPTTAEDVEKMITEFIPQATRASREVNNEVRAIAVDNSAPSAPSPLNRCKPTFEETKELITAYVQKIKERSKDRNAVTEKEFPVFSYSPDQDRDVAEAPRHHRVTDNVHNGQWTWAAR